MTRTLHAFALAACLALSVAPAIAQDDGAAIATATAVLDHMEAGDFDAATRDFDANMKAQLGTTQLAGVQMQIESAGAVQSRGAPVVTQRDGHTVVVHRIQREHAALDAIVAIDGEGKVAGLYFTPAAPGPQ
jgi:hypothetical protein